MGRWRGSGAEGPACVAAVVAAQGRQPPGTSEHGVWTELEVEGWPSVCHPINSQVRAARSVLLPPSDSGTGSGEKVGRGSRCRDDVINERHKEAS